MRQVAGGSMVGRILEGQCCIFENSSKAGWQYDQDSAGNHNCSPLIQCRPLGESWTRRDDQAQAETCNC